WCSRSRGTQPAQILVGCARSLELTSRPCFNWGPHCGPSAPRALTRNQQPTRKRHCVCSPDNPRGECHMHRYTLLHRRVASLALLLCALAVAACGGSATTQGGASSSPTSTLPPTQTSTPALPSAGTVSATISGLGALGADDGYGIAASDTAVWVLNGNTGNVLRIDPRTNTLVATIPVAQGGGSIALGQGAVWVASPYAGN